MNNLDVPDMKRILTFPHGISCVANQVLYNLKGCGMEYDLLS